MFTRFLLSSIAVAALTASLPAQAQQVKVTITNLAPAQGVLFTPVWVGFHNGLFDPFDAGETAITPIERLAEDGNTAPISDMFSARGYTHQATLPGTGGAIANPPLFEPGETISMVFDLNGADANNRYLSFLSMILPSNDAFIGNDNAKSLKVFNDDGSFAGADFTISGAHVWDAGTEVNDEIPAHVPVLGQAAPNTGVSEIGGPVRQHAGFIPGGNILTAFPGGDFTQAGYQIAHVQVTAVPEPETYAMLLAGLGLVGLVARRRKPKMLHIS